MVSDDDYELVSQYRWHPHKNHRGRTFYGHTNVKVDGKQTTVQMHRLIMGFPDYQVDHQNGNGLDCQRHNLRKANDSQNKANKAKPRGQYSSVWKGVTWHKRAGKWQAKLQANGKQNYLGLFSDEVEAAKAYDRAAVAAFGEFSCTNFPVEDYQFELIAA